MKQGQISAREKERRQLAEGLSLGLNRRWEEDDLHE